MRRYSHLAVLAALLATAPLRPAEPRPDLVPVPFPDTAGLEPEVAGQLAAVRASLTDALANPGTAAEKLAEVYGAAGKTYLAYDLGEAASAAFADASRLAPNDLDWIYYLAYLDQKAGRLDAAADRYRQVLGAAPGDLAARVHLGEVELARNHLEAAETAFHEALAKAPGNAAAEAGLGQVALSRKAWAEAARHLEAAVAAVPAATQLHYPLALAYRGLGELDKAKAELARRGGAGIRPPDPRIEALDALREGERPHTLRGRKAFRAGDFAGAAREFQAAVEAAPTSASARVNLGTALGQLGDRAGAIATYKEALELDPTNATAHFNLGSLLVAAGEPGAALPHLRAALSARPADREARLALADALQRAGRPEDSLIEYRKAAEGPSDGRADLGEATALVGLGRYRQARDLLDTTLGRRPDDGLLAHALARLLAGCPQLDLRDGPRALDLASRVFAARPTSEHAETLAMALAEVGRCAEAARLQGQVVAAAEKAGDPRVGALQEAAGHYQEGPPCRFRVPRPER